MRQTPYYVFDTDEFAKRAAMIRAALDCKGGRRIPLCFSIKANPFLLHRLPEGLDHVEVCSPGELSYWKTDPWKVVVDGDKIRGRGVEDNQQAIVCGLLIAQELKAQGIDPSEFMKNSMRN